MLLGVAALLLAAGSPFLHSRFQNGGADLLPRDSQSQAVPFNSEICACPGAAPEGPEPEPDVPRPYVPYRPAIDWASLGRTTRWSGTITTFGWPLKRLVTAPGPLLLQMWGFGGAFEPGSRA